MNEHEQELVDHLQKKIRNIETKIRNIKSLIHVIKAPGENQVVWSAIAKWKGKPSSENQIVWSAIETHFREIERETIDGRLARKLLDCVLGTTPWWQAHKKSSRK
jgi:hypothetical protein